MSRSRTNRPSFTLIELLAAILIIGILASTMLVALYGAIESAKEDRTRAQIQKLNELLAVKWESYRTRALRLDFANDRKDTFVVNGIKLLALRDLMRMELPDRVSDVTYGPANLRLPSPVTGGLSQQYRLPAPSLWTAYRRRAQYQSNNTPLTWEATHQGAECLYMIVAMMRDGDSSALDYFMEREIADTDGDGMPELLDAWGRPIEFIRWAPGYSVNPGDDHAWGVAGADDDGNNTTDDLVERHFLPSDDFVVSEIHRLDIESNPDAFDPLQVDDDMRRFLNLPARLNFGLMPLVFSSGPDRFYDIITDSGQGAIAYAQMNLPNDPYHVIPATADTPEMQLGTPWDANQNGVDNSVDNITNHLLTE
jgi:prepilin-type N-terminal cleavage/methylation domain-containing protein